MIIFRVWQRHTRLSVVPGIVCLLLLVVPVLGHAEQFTGKVVSILDGDTISVLREGKAVKVRLYGLVPRGAAAEQFTGKVVAIADGDTIQVLREGRAVKVRLYGVDAPEKAQAFGTQARKFTGDL